jgi:hypothetical protein
MLGIEISENQRETDRECERAARNSISNPLPPQTRISVACDSDRDSIYALRHEVYAEELRQHPTASNRMLSDSLDAFNEYIVASIDGQLAGFVSITPPGFGKYSIDKYLARENVDISFDEGLYEIRILTVARPHRGARVAAASRWSR